MSLQGSLSPLPAHPGPADQHRWSWIALLVLLVWCPLPLASNRSWASALLAILLVATFAGLALHSAWSRSDFLRAGRSGGAADGIGSALAHGHRHRRFDSAWWPVALLGSYALLVALQLLPLPTTWSQTSASGLAAAAPISVEPFATRQYLLTTLGCTAAFVLVRLLATTAARVQALLLTVLCSGVLQIVVASGFYSAEQDFRFLFMPVLPGSRLGGTFMNPDHLAGYIELCFAAGLGLFLVHTGNGAALGGWRKGAVQALRFVQSGKMLVRLLLIALVIGLVMTHSRMGNAAFFVSLLLVGGLCALRSRALRRPASWLVVSVLIVDILVVGQWVGLDKVIQRLAATPAAANGQAAWRPGEPAPWREEALDERTQAARYALDMVQSRPLLGFGGGSFYIAFPPFKGTHRLGFYDHAHNDYVEIAADTGLLGLGLLVALVLLSSWRALRALGNDGDPLARGVAAAVLMAVFCLGLHSLVDFNLQVPANALTFTVILALAWTVPLAPAGGPVPTRTPVLQALVVVAVAALAAWTAWQGGKIVLADLTSVAARDELQRWAYAPADAREPDWPQLQADLRTALQWTPDDAVLHDAMAQLHTAHALAIWNDEPQRLALYAEARRSQEASLALRPLGGVTWAGLAVSLFVTAQPVEQVHSAWRLALRHAPREAAVESALFELAFATWPDAAPDIRDWVATRWQSLPEGRRRVVRALADKHGRAAVLD